MHNQNVKKCQNGSKNIRLQICNLLIMAFLLSNYTKHTPLFDLDIVILGGYNNFRFEKTTAIIAKIKESLDA